MYIPGRVLTASSPSSTFMLEASYCLSVFAIFPLILPRERLCNQKELCAVAQIPD